MLINLSGVPVPEGSPLLAKNTSSVDFTQIGASAAKATELLDEITRKEGVFPRTERNEGSNIWKTGGVAEVGLKNELLNDELRKLGLFGPRTAYVFGSMNCVLGSVR